MEYDLGLYPRLIKSYLCWIPLAFTKLLNSVELHGGPLSVLILVGTPNKAKISFNIDILAFADVDVVVFTIGYRE